MAKILGADVEVDHIAIGEALFWGITIDELLMKRFPTTYESAREGDSNGAGVDGARLARNAIAHGAILVHSYQGGMTFPMTFPAMFGMPLWRPVDELLRAWSPRATPRLARQVDSYRHHFASRSSAAPIRELHAWLTNAATLGFAL
jgi:hypothetical protein